MQLTGPQLHALERLRSAHPDWPLFATRAEIVEPYDRIHPRTASSLEARDLVKLRRVPYVLTVNGRRTCRYLNRVDITEAGRSEIESVFTDR